jgi:anti-sigma B factor antagonist
VTVPSPTAPGFALSEQTIWPGCLEINVAGELDLAVAEELRAALDRAMEKRLHVLVDLSACEFIDVSGVEALLQGHERLAAHGLQLLLYGVGGQVRRMLAVTGLSGANHSLLDAGQTGALAAAA